MRIVLVDNSEGDDNELTNALHRRLLGLTSDVVRCTTVSQVSCALSETHEIPVHGICLGGSTLNMSATTMHERNVRKCAVALLQGTNVPVLGICFGMHYVTTAYGGAVRRLPAPRFGVYPVVATQMEGVSGLAYFSHQDVVVRPPPGFHTEAVCSDTGIVCEMRSERFRCTVVQYHPERCTGPCAMVLERFVRLARDSVIPLCPSVRINDRDHMHIVAHMGKRSLTKVARDHRIPRDTVERCWNAFRVAFHVPPTMF
jgi:GMP synthase-like glutamine amidotransferase